MMDFIEFILCCIKCIKYCLVTLKMSGLSVFQVKRAVQLSEVCLRNYLVMIIVCKTRKKTELNWLNLNFIVLIGNTLDYNPQRTP